MSESQTLQGKFRYDKDTKRCYRFQIELDSGINGTVYIPRGIAGGIPKQIILEYVDRSEQDIVVSQVNYQQETAE